MTLPLTQSQAAAATAQARNTNRLLDHLISNFQLKNDAALARAIEVSAPVLSKIRHGRLKLGATEILAIHEAFDMPIREIKALAGVV